MAQLALLAGRRCRARSPLRCPRDDFYSFEASLGMEGTGRALRPAQTAQLVTQLPLTGSALSALRAAYLITRLFPNLLIRPSTARIRSRIHPFARRAAALATLRLCFLNNSSKATRWPTRWHGYSMATRWRIGARCEGADCGTRSAMRATNGTNERRPHGLAATAQLMRIRSSRPSEVSDAHAQPSWRERALGSAELAMRRQKSHRRRTELPAGMAHHHPSCWFDPTTGPRVVVRLRLFRLFRS